MSGYQAQANINSIRWEGNLGTLKISPDNHLPVALEVWMKATDLAGLDPTRPITITQEPTPSPEPADWAAPGGDVR